MSEERLHGVERHSEITERPEELSPPVDLNVLKQSLAESKAKAQEYLDGWQRAQADFINYKRRLEQDKIDAISYANAGLITKILPVLDDFERAIAAVPPSVAEEPWVGGINGISRKLESTLESVGLSRIKVQGELFDPSVHEAVGSVPGKEGLVVMEMQKGYKLNDRVLRPSKVMVGSGEGDAEENQAEE